MQRAGSNEHGYQLIKRCVLNRQRPVLQPPAEQENCDLIESRISGSEPRFSSRMYLAECPSAAIGGFLDSQLHSAAIINEWQELSRVTMLIQY